MARLRYTEDHWARRAPTDEHLAEYLAGADTYNLTKVHLFERRLGDDLAGKRVLDYGGGAGFMAVRCAERGAQVTLVDAAPTALETATLLATKRGDKNWFGWDPTHLRFYTPRSLRWLFRRAGYVPRHWSGVYIIPYNIVSWFLLGRRRIELDALHKFDLWFGHLFPFNRLGWNVVVEGVRSSVHEM